MQLCTVRCVQSKEDSNYILLGYLWQREGNQNWSLFGSEEGRTASCLGTKKKTIQNLTKISNVFYLKKSLEESNVFMQSTQFFWLQKCMAMYSWVEPNRTLSKVRMRAKSLWCDQLLLECLFHCFGWMNWINYFHSITKYRR